MLTFCFDILHYVHSLKQKKPNALLISAKCICSPKNQLVYCFYSHKEDKHPQQSEMGRSKASSLCVYIRHAIVPTLTSSLETMLCLKS